MLKSINRNSERPCTFVTAFWLGITESRLWQSGQINRTNSKIIYKLYFVMAITNDNLCLTMMMDLEEAAGQANDPMRSAQPVGLLSSLTSASNTNGNGIETEFVPGDGKTHKVIVKYMSPTAEAEITDTITNICDDECISGSYKYDEVTLTLTAQSPVYCLTEAEMRLLCETGNEFRMKIIAGGMNALRRDINAKLITPFYNGAGGIIGSEGDVGQSYDLLYRDGQVQVNNEEEILMLRDLTDAGVQGVPIMVGGRNIDLWRRLKDIGCCNSYGQNNEANLLGDVAFFYDNQLNTVLTTPSDSNNSAFYVYQPGAAQFISKPMNVGQFRRVTDDTIFDTIIDPLTGERYDFEMIYDRCTRSWKWKLYSYFDIWQVPIDVFKDTDERAGINWNFVFQANESAPSA